MKNDHVKKMVKDGYAKVAKQGSSCCCAPKTSCCGESAAESISKKIGYSEEDLNAVPEGANLGLGCGNPTVLASLPPGEIVLDLGSGAGLGAVRVVEESLFPLDVMANDPTAQAILDQPKVSEADLKSAENSVVRIKVSARK